MPPTKKAAKSKSDKEDSGNSKPQPRTTGYRVECSSYPSGMGCYAGQDLSDDYIDSCTTTKVVGEYDTLAQAKNAAVRERDGHCEFDDWAEEFYNDNGPPFFSVDGENYDEDEAVHIYIVDIAKEAAKKGKEKAGKQKAMENARSSKPPAKKKPKTASFGATKGNFKLEDMEIFLRNPSRVPGGEPHMPADYGHGTGGKDSFAYLIQRLSDRNYVMRSHCLENSGARYTSFKKRNIIRRCMHWIPDTNLNDHASDETILDTFHTDLFHHKTGTHSLTPETLLACVKPNIECLFLTNFAKRPDHKSCSKSIVKTIQTCSPNLKCVTLNMCAISIDILDALAKCPQLMGVTFQDNETGTYSDSAVRQFDTALAKVLTSCPLLRWLHIDRLPFQDACWAALNGTAACPQLQVLWVDCPVRKDGRMHVTAGNHDMIRRVLTARSNLSLCMINPDDKLKSSFIMATDAGTNGGGGGSKKVVTYDKLNGKKEPRMPDFEDFYY